jgi:hypothetical protein
MSSESKTNPETTRWPINSVAENLDAQLRALYAETERLRAALTNFIYETTHLSPQRDDGSHDCRISAATLNAGKEALKL